MYLKRTTYMFLGELWGLLEAQLVSCWSTACWTVRTASFLCLYICSIGVITYIFSYLYQYYLERQDVPETDYLHVWGVLGGCWRYNWSHVGQLLAGLQGQQASSFYTYVLLMSSFRSPHYDPIVIYIFPLHLYPLRSYDCLFLNPEKIFWNPFIPLFSPNYDPIATHCIHYSVSFLSQLKYILLF
jgi:hypothetical protein